MSQRQTCKTLSVEEGEPGEEAACRDVPCVTYSHYIRKKNPQPTAWLRIYHINSVFTMQWIYTHPHITPSKR